MCNTKHFYMRDLNIIWFWHLRGSQSQSLIRYWETTLLLGLRGYFLLPNQSLIKIKWFVWGTWSNNNQFLKGLVLQLEPKLYVALDLGLEMKPEQTALSPFPLWSPIPAQPCSTSVFLPWEPHEQSVSSVTQSDLFQWVSSLHQVAKVLEFQLQHQSFQWIFRTDLF